MILRVVHWNDQNIGGQDWWIEAWSLQHTYNVFFLRQETLPHIVSLDPEARFSNVPITFRPGPRGPFLECPDNFSARKAILCAQC